MKKCSKCGKIKPIEEFSWRNKQKGWKCSECKACARERGKNYYEQNKEQARQYREQNKDKIIEQARQYYEQNKEQVRQYYKQNKEKINERNQQYYEHNKEKINEQARQYYKQNKEQRRQYHERNREKINAQIRQWRNDKYKFDPMFRLNECISTGIRHSLKNGKNGCHWEDLVGYSLEELKEHLEAQFKDGMTWENYGQWHIDHIIAISHWKFEKPEDSEFRQCWALCNLQPLWANENIRKGNRLLIAE